MTATQQIENFTAFAKALAQQEGEGISLDEIYDRWWQEQKRNEDLEAIQTAVKDYAWRIQAMPRPKYCITEDDYQHAHFYLSL